MKKAIFSLAATTLLLASCDTTTKDSFERIPFQEFNLIVDTYDMEQPAVVSGSVYRVNTNLTKGVVDITTNDIIVNNQKYSFETDTMAIRTSTFTTQDGTKVGKLSFSKSGPAGVGSAASDFKGSYVRHMFRYSGIPDYPTVALNNPSYQIGYYSGLDLNYMLADRYLVQTFWPESLFQGTSYAVEENNSFSTAKTDYFISLDFHKNLGTLYIYHPEYTYNQDKEFPQIIKVDGISVKMSHDRFSLEASEPATTVLTTKDGKTDFFPNSAFNVTDFSMTFFSQDVTEAEIKYTIAGKKVTFSGCSVLKPGK